MITMMNNDYLSMDSNEEEGVATNETHMTCKGLLQGNVLMLIL